MNDTSDDINVTKDPTDTATTAIASPAAAATVPESEEDEGDDDYDDEDHEEPCRHGELPWDDYRLSETYHAQHPLLHDVAASCLLALIVDGCCQGVSPFEQPTGVTAAVPYGSTIFPDGLFIAWQGPILGDGDPIAARAVLGLRGWLPTVGLREIGFSDEPDGMPLRIWVMLAAIDRGSPQLVRDTFGRPVHEDVVRGMIESFLDEFYFYVTNDEASQPWSAMIALGARHDG
jgi:hypothetical protein